jgi:hypothetical protein
MTINQEIAELELELKGKAEVEAEIIVKNKGYRFRVTERNGIAQITTRDYDTNRLNVSVRDGILETVRGFG